ncbi:MAG: carboxypeptidase-like regulatory domain-containing protein [Planctomycetota bacterium]|jgi:hypothetical protein|nr:carboxypeptidase-like regulatory domain-containing protein [Planctomycetota bacterium]MDP6505889.1 carboxypeptidase-like regulatory domain-containing protein [Planctomycetota bacterium]
MNRLRQDLAIQFAGVGLAIVLTGGFTMFDNMVLGEGAGKKIESGKPTLSPKNHEAWNEKGRIVGKIRQSPGCEVEALGAGGEVVKSFEVKPAGKAFELEWLKPGEYKLRVTAKGYKTLVLDGLEVRARNDLRIDLEF